MGTEQDTGLFQRARTGWIEWFTCSKTCLLVLPGGTAKAKRNHNILLNRVAIRVAGERAALWEEGVRLTKADSPPKLGRKRKLDPEKMLEQDLDRKRETVIDLARRGLPGKAVSHASSLGLAPDTRATERIMRSKFVAPPTSQRDSASRRSMTLEANTITDEDVVKAIRSFGAGVSAGRSGQRPDSYKQLIGETPELRPY